MARFGFVRACARSQVAVGILFMVLGPVAAGAAFLWWPVEPPAWVSAEWRGFVPALVAVGVFLLGIAIGSRLVLRGQVLLMLLEMRRSLARIDRHVRQSGSMDKGHPDRRDATTRLLPRR
ncbi:MAG: hypothetical protein DME04_18555 [Candidatus Rokuibacteriota bacterium]|nr:MAG: hypothetical protein DME04_18555 [Candidatus Rokubacteria bacterium]